MKVFGWAADAAGCGYYRMGLPLAALGRAGHDTQVSIALTGFERTADVVVGQRVCNPAPSRWWQRTCALPTGKRPVMVYELDDDLWRIPTGNGISHRYFQQEDRIGNMTRNIAASDLVTVSTSYLAEVVRERIGPGVCPPIVVLSNCISESLFYVDKPYRQDHVLGWAGSGTHRPDFRDAGPQIARFLRRNKAITWHAVGADFLPEDIPARDYTAWVDGVEDYYRHLDFTVGVAPLVDHPFNWSKSHIKALEYAARSIPVVASNVGPYADYVAHGETGFLVDQDHEWGSYLHRLFRDPALRYTMGEKSRRAAESGTMQANWPRWEATYKGALDAV